MAKRVGRIRGRSKLYDYFQPQLGCRFCSLQELSGVSQPHYPLKLKRMQSKIKRGFLTGLVISFL